MQKILAKISLNIIIGIILIFVWSRFVNLNEIVLRLQTANFYSIFLIFLSIAISGAIRALRFKKILNISEISLIELAFLNYLSQLLSFLIPIRAGEIAKGAYLSTQYQLSFTKSLVWVFIDRFLDFWMFVVIVAILLPFVPSNISGNLANLLIAALVILTILLIASIKSAAYMQKVVAFFLPFLIFPKLKEAIGGFADSIIDGFTILNRSSKEWGVFILLSLIAAISDGLAWYLSFNSLNFNLTVIQSVLGNALAAFTFLIPAAPGYVGSAEAAGLAVFSGILRAPTDISSAATVFFHLSTLISLLILGVSGLFFLKFDLNFVWKKLKGG